MSATDTTALDLFIHAVLDDDDRGYPDDVAFVSADLPDIDEILWRNLSHEHRATVVVTGVDVEVLFKPHHRAAPLGWIDELRRKVYVEVGWRHHALASPYTVRTRVGRRQLADMRRPPVCA